MKGSESHDRLPNTHNFEKRNSRRNSDRTNSGTGASRDISSRDIYYDRPIPKPTTDLGFHGIRHKSSYDSLAQSRRHPGTRRNDVRSN
jgi:hypothetical protein